MKSIQYLMFALVSCITSVANATILVNIQEVGANVVVSYSGSLNLNSTAGKEADRFSSNNALFDVGVGTLQTYNTNGNVDDYNFVASSITRPTVDLINGILIGGTLSGDQFLFDLWNAGGQIWVNDGYVSGTTFSGQNIFSNTSFATLNPTLGTYEWSWSNNGFSDNLILTVGQVQQVPEPASLALLGLGLAGICLSRRKTKRQ